MNLFVVGQGPVRLGQADFVGQGGEAAIYVQGERAFKIYHDPARALPAAKIGELAALTEPSIIRPEALVLDARNRPAGYAMRRVQGGVVLCQVFNRSFRERKGVTPEAIFALVQRLQAGVRHVHDQGMLIVDLNELNFLLDGPLREVLFIDVDSYQTPGFPATAVMESIRDRHSSRFTEGSDWFSFAVVSFQMFVGIHPYKGKHPTLHNLDARMLAHASVLDPQVALPKVCYPFDVIPQAYRAWYRAVLQEGRREPPPAGARWVITLSPVVQSVSGSGHLRIRELERFPAEIVAVFRSGAGLGAVTAGGVYAGGRQVLAATDVRVGVTPRLGHTVAAVLDGSRVELHDLTAGRLIPCSLRAEALMTCGDRIYLKAVDTVHELEFVELPVGVQAVPRPVGNVMPHAARVFDGVVTQDVLGAGYVSLFPTPGTCHTVRVPALDGCQVVDGRFENGVLMLVGARAGRYDRYVLRFDPRYRSYDLRVVEDVPFAGLNFVVLNHGVCLHLNEAEELEIFSNRKDEALVKTLAEPALHGARLHHRGAQALFSRGGVVYSMTLL